VPVRQEVPPSLDGLANCNLASLADFGIRLDSLCRIQNIPSARFATMTPSAIRQLSSTSTSRRTSRATNRMMVLPTRYVLRHHHCRIASNKNAPPEQRLNRAPDDPFYRRAAILWGIGLLAFYHGFTVDIGGDSYGIVESSTDPICVSAASADIHRTWLVAGSFSEVEPPVGPSQRSTSRTQSQSSLFWLAWLSVAGVGVPPDPPAGAGLATGVRPSFSPSLTKLSSARWDSQ
jgi:hypothetical protein